MGWPRDLMLHRQVTQLVRFPTIPVLPRRPFLSLLPVCSCCRCGQRPHRVACTCNIVYRHAHQIPGPGHVAQQPGPAHNAPKVRFNAGGFWLAKGGARPPHPRTNKAPCHPPLRADPCCSSARPRPHYESSPCFVFAVDCVHAMTSPLCVFSVV